MKKQTIAIFALVIAQVFWGASYLLSDRALQVFSPAFLVTLRISIAAIVLGIIGLTTGKIQKVKLKDFKFFVLAAFVEPFVYFLCEAKALNSGVSPTITSVMISLIPLLTPVFAYIVLREKVTWTNLLGIIVSIIGVLMIILDKDGEMSVSMVGFVLLFIAILASISYTLVLRKIPEHYNTLTIVFYNFCISLCFFIPTSLITEWDKISSLQWNQDTINAFYAIIALALSASCVAFLFFSFGVRIIGPNRANVFNNIPPGVTAILSIFILNEMMPLLKWIGLVIVIIGMFISQINVSKVKDKINLSKGYVKNKNQNQNQVK